MKDEIADAERALRAAWHGACCHDLRNTGLEWVKKGPGSTGLVRRVAAGLQKRRLEGARGLVGIDNFAGLLVGMIRRAHHRRRCNIDEAQ